jgi:high-affinity iron transporter
MTSMRIERLKKQIFLSFVFLLFLSTLPHAAQAADSKEALLPTVGDALVDVRSEDYDSLNENLRAYEKAWESTKRSEDLEETEKQIDKELDTALKMSADSSVEQEALYEHIVNLARYTDEYVSAAGEESEIDRADMQSLIDDLNEMQSVVKDKNFAKARKLNEAFVTNWTALEKPIRESNLQAYGSIETKMSMVRVALNKDPVKVDQAVQSLDKLKVTIQDYLDGKTADSASTMNTDSVTLTGLIGMLENVQSDIDKEEYNNAATKMEKFIQQWPIVEGKVLTKSQSVYNETETKMTEVLTIISSSQPDSASANKKIDTMIDDLEPFTEQSKYSAWDAFFILFREGLEAILIIATLLAYLRRTDNEEQRVWVWSGLGLGLIFSGGLAVILTMMFAGLQSGTNREIIEGVTGLIAVVMMLTVGAWLHKQSNILAWNQYINQQLQKVMNRGAKWMLALVTFIAIFREGAETIIFYLGMAPSITVSQLLQGMGGALVLLIIIGFLLIKLSVRLPIRPFFLVASLLIYYIAFKFTGVSVHALQITNILPVHQIGSLPIIDFLGFYPTFETVIAQLVLLLIVAYQFISKNNRKRHSRTKAAS